MIVVKPNQSVLDIAIEHTGSVDTLFDILAANNSRSLKISERNLNLPAVKNNVTLNYIRANGISPATSINVVDVILNDFDDNDFDEFDFN